MKRFLSAILLLLLSLFTFSQDMRPAPQVTGLLRTFTPESEFVGNGVSAFYQYSIPDGQQYNSIRFVAAYNPFSFPTQTGEFTSGISNFYSLTYWREFGSISKSHPVAGVTVDNLGNAYAELGYLFQLNLKSDSSYQRTITAQLMLSQSTDNRQRIDAIVSIPIFGKKVDLPNHKIFIPSAGIYYVPSLSFKDFEYSETVHSIGMYLILKLF